MKSESYSHQDEDFFGKKALSLLDTWVFDKVITQFLLMKCLNEIIRWNIFLKLPKMTSR